MQKLAEAIANTVKAGQDHD
ncbi:hemolytic protein, partial [Staphylococcus capitis]